MTFETGSVQRPRVLVVEDDTGIADAVQYLLTKDAAFHVDVAKDGQGALAMACAQPYSLVILDLMLGDINGRSICPSLKATVGKPAVCMLTALSDREDVLAGFDAGADDYVAKPFDPDELVARARALVRRNSAQQRPSATRIQDLLVDIETREALVGRQSLKLTRREFDLLLFFIKHMGSVINRDQLLQAVWPDGTDVTLNSVDVYVGYLRRKLANAEGNVPRISTVRGVGFRMVSQS